MSSHTYFFDVQTLVIEVVEEVVLQGRGNLGVFAVGVLTHACRMQNNIKTT